MKITGLECLHANAGFRNFDFLKISTDEGLVGWSEYNESFGGMGVTEVINNLAGVLVGEDPASQVYVRNKGIATKEVGMNSLEFRLPADTPQEVLLNKVRALNNDPDVHGILVQFPVPEQISQQAVIDTISPEKDVDGLHPVNAGRLASGHLTGRGAALVPCTPQGSVLFAHTTLGDLSGAHAVVVGR